MPRRDEEEEPEQDVGQAEVEEEEDDSNQGKDCQWSGMVCVSLAAVGTGHRRNAAAFAGDNSHM